MKTRIAVQTVVLIAALCVTADADDFVARSLGATVLNPAMPESDVRLVIRNAEPQASFVIPAGASWTLKKTLMIPHGIGIYGQHPGGGGGCEPTFIKGFNGPLAFVSSFVTLQGVTFDGNKKAGFTGDGVVAVGEKRKRWNKPGSATGDVRELRMIRVDISNNAGDGYVMSAHHYYSHFEFVGFDHNDGYGLVYGEVRAHHTDNVFNSCHWGWNKKGGVAFHGVEASSIWENCEFFHNGGAAFEHFLINKKRGAGKPIGPSPSSGAGALVIRNTVIRNCPGPVWLNRGGKCESIVFQDCRLKHNGDPKDSHHTKDSGKSAAELFGLTAPVGGIFHVERGQLFAEIRGGFAWDNTGYMFTATRESTPGSRLTIGGAAAAGHVTGGVYAPTGLLTVQDASLLQDDAHIHVQSGVGLDPRKGGIVKYGPAPAPPPAAE